MNPPPPKKKVSLRGGRLFKMGIFKTSLDISSGVKLLLNLKHIAEIDVFIELCYQQYCKID
jgi:hypothetical protein